MEKTLLNITLILIFTKIAGSISKRFKMPEVLGALIAGVILGPLTLNLVQYDNNLKLLSNLGVIFLMFLAGIETKVDDLKKAGFTSFIIAISGVIVPLILGTLYAYMFFPNFYENLFIGVILTATSVSITVETLTEMGKLNSRSGINILGAAVIDDVLGLILISIVIALASEPASYSGNANLSIIWTIIKILLFCVLSIISILYLPKYASKFLKFIRPGKAFLSYSIALGLLLAYIAEILGIAAITGAYIAGVFLSCMPHKEYLERNIKSISSGFLSPIFFASVGIEANLNGLNSETILISIVMFIVAILGKIIGCGFAARLVRLQKSEALQIGIGMISRGEVAIITANIGLQKHIISEEVFLPTLIVVILTTIITPILLKLSFSHRNEKLVESIK